MWNKNTLSTAIFLTVYICIMPQVTEAYIDPGTGSLIVQAVLATIFGASFAIKVYWNKLKSSFRDPSGSLFTKEGVLHRRISNIYKKHWEHAERSGLHQELIREKLLIPHADLGPGGAVDAYRIIRPTRIPFISYPYEWCFSQLKDAALLTLEVQKRALRHEMILKDASAFNVQFLDGRPIFIDPLSFEMYEEGSPWIGYRQFCQHFLAPLALMSRTDIRLNRLFQIFLDGIPLDLASSLLPWSTWFSPLLLSHIHLHAKSQKRFESEKSAPVYKI